MNLQTLQQTHSVLNIFVELAKIPSPSLKEEKVREKILEFLNHPKIETIVDDFGNVIARILPTDKSKKSLLLSAHMDVAGDASDVCVKISEEEK